MAKTDIHLQDIKGNNTEGQHQNLTGQDSGTRRGMHVMEAPSTGAKSITPTDNTDVAFAHRYVYIGTGGDLVVQFEEGTDADTFTFIVPDGALLPIEVYSINSSSTTADGILLLS